MRRTLFTLLAILLAMTNIVMMADAYAEVFTGQIRPNIELCADNPCSPGRDGSREPQCQHCCHAQGHLTSLPQRSQAWSIDAGHDWTLNDSVHPHPLRYAPPVPPPRA